MPGDSRRRGRRPGSVLVAGHVIVKFAALAVPPLSLITCLITISFGGDVVVGDRAGLRLADGDRARAVGRVARRSTRRARSRRPCSCPASRVTVVPGTRHRGSRRVRCPVADRHREVRRARRAAVVVDHVLDHDQLRRLRRRDGDLRRRTGGDYGGAASVGGRIVEVVAGCRRDGDGEVEGAAPPWQGREGAGPR